MWEGGGGEGVGCVCEDVCECGCVWVCLSVWCVLCMCVPCSDALYFSACSSFTENSGPHGILGVAYLPITLNGTIRFEKNTGSALRVRGG